MTPFIYYHFLTLRYTSRRNPYTRNMFHELRLATETVANQPKVRFLKFFWRNCLNEMNGTRFEWCDKTFSTRINFKIGTLNALSSFNLLRIFLWKIFVKSWFQEPKIGKAKPRNRLELFALLNLKIFLFFFFWNHKFKRIDQVQIFLALLNYAILTFKFKFETKLWSS